MLQSTPGCKLPPHRRLLQIIAGCLLLLALYFPLKGHAQTKQTITLINNRISLEKIFREIKKQTNYDMLYNPAKVDTSAIVSVNARNMPLEEFLDDLSRRQSLVYSLINTTIVIENRRRPDAVATNPLPQDPILRGIVMEEKSRTPLFGVSVVLKRTGKGTQTSAQGNFELKEFNESDSLVFSIIGYQTRTLAASAFRTIGMVSLKVAVNELDEAIVQAYGVTSRRLTTGNTVKISGEEISRQPVQNPLQALQGRVTGMSINPTSAYANAPLKVEIRGRNSLNLMSSGDPLYIIDGVPQTVLGLDNPAVQREGTSSGLVQMGVSYSNGQSPLFGINQYDIESIEVLKDADATAIYGSRGANGVVIITTKRPKTGKTVYNFNVSQGINGVTKFPKLLEPATYRMIRREALKNDGIEITPVTAPDLVLWDTTRYTNWQKQYYGTGKNTQVSASVSGGDLNSRFGLSANYSRQTGMNDYSGATEVFGISLRSDLNSKDRKLQIGATVDFRSTFADAIGSVAATDLPPNAPPMLNAEGKPNFIGWDLPDNTNNYPWGSVFQNNETRASIFTGSVNMAYFIMKGLDINTTISYNQSVTSSDVFQPAITRHPKENPLGNAIFGNTKITSLTVKPTLNYSRFISRGNLRVTIGVNHLREQTSGMMAFGTGYTNDELIRSITNAPIVQVSDNFVQRKYIGTVAQVFYNWENKYMITLNANRDGSSQFGPGRQFGNYGSIGVSWNASEEKWMQKIMPSWMNFIKLIANYGLTGSNNVGDYQYLSQWGSFTSNGTSPLYDYGGIRPFVPNLAVNQNYHWETTKQFSASGEVQMFDKMFSMRIGYYHKLTDDQLTRIPTPQYTGFGSVLGNSPALVRNTGVELDMNGTVIRKKDFSIIARFNISMNRNKLLAFPNVELSPWASSMRVGESLNTKYLLHYLGVDPLTGRPSFEDYTKDGVITDNLALLPGAPDNDRYVAINTNPEFEGGGGISVSYKAFQFNTGLSFSKGYIRNPFLQGAGRMTNLVLADEIIANTWRKPGDQALYPRFSTNSGIVSLNNADIVYSDMWVVRFNDLSFAYNLPASILKRIRVSNCSLSLTTSNFFFFSRYKGFDPVLGNSPVPRVIVTRLSITL